MEAEHGRDDVGRGGVGRQRIGALVHHFEAWPQLGLEHEGVIRVHPPQYVPRVLQALQLVAKPITYISDYPYYLGVTTSYL